MPPSVHLLALSALLLAVLANPSRSSAFDPDSLTPFCSSLRRTSTLSQQPSMVGRRPKALARVG